MYCCRKWLTRLSFHTLFRKIKGAKTFFTLSCKIFLDWKLHSPNHLQSCFTHVRMISTDSHSNSDWFYCSSTNYKNRLQTFTKKYNKEMKKSYKNSSKANYADCRGAPFGYHTILVWWLVTYSS